MRRSTTFKPGETRAREAGRRGGQVSQAARRGQVAPYAGSVLDLMDAAGMTGPDWLAWRVFLKAAYGLPMSDDEVAVFRRHTERETPPTTPAASAVMVVGRRGGKSSIAALVAVHGAITFNAAHIRPGESVLVPLIASDRRQARLLLRYVHGLCRLPAVAPFVHRAIKEVIEFTTGVNVEVVTASVAAPRGPTIPVACCDEVAYWRTADDSANPDEEVVAAVQGGMATIPNALLLVLSSPYGQQGVLYEAVEQSFGKDDPDVLVWNADTLSMHPAGEDAAGHALRRAVDRMWQRDPVKAASEYGRDGRVVFRTSTASSFLSPEVVDGAMDAGVRERAPDFVHRYVAFVDVSGARRDAWALGIAHKDAETGMAVLDVLRQRQPPLDIAATISQWMDVLVAYDVREVTGDRYAGEFSRQAWAAAGMPYALVTLTKDQLYLEVLSVLNTERVRLLDDPTLRAQLVALHRKARPGGGDKVDHPVGGHDDASNAAVGAVLLALGVGEAKREQRRVVRWA